ncbi:hypothetical protein ACWDSL_16060 [Streptomyces sp. NPDC000941]
MSEVLSVSASLSPAAERAAKIEAGLIAAEEVLAEIGPCTLDELAWVDAFMDTVTRPVANDDADAGAGGSDR